MPQQNQSADESLERDPLLDRNDEAQIDELGDSPAQVGARSAGQSGSSQDCRKLPTQTRRASRNWRTRIKLSRARQLRVLKTPPIIPNARRIPTRNMGVRRMCQPVENQPEFLATSQWRCRLQFTLVEAASGISCTSVCATNSWAVKSGVLFNRYFRPRREAGNAEGSTSRETTGTNGFPMPIAAPISKKRLGRLRASDVTNRTITLLSRNPFSTASDRDCPE